MSGEREFYPHVKYHDCWWAYVSVVGAIQEGYWRTPRLTRLGAKFAAHRKAAWLRQAERRGWLD